MSTYGVPDELIQHPHSPSVVQDDEILCRTYIHPTQVDADGSLAPSAVPLQDLTDPDRGGLSVYREKYCDKKNMQAASIARACADEAGYASLLTKCARNIIHKNERAFVVIDTAKEEDNSHASIYLVITGIAKGEKKKLRLDLIKCFHEYKIFESI
jgi:hypothetical protein